MRAVVALGLCCGLLACSNVSSPPPQSTTVKSQDVVKAMHTLTCQDYVCELGLAPSQVATGCPLTAADDAAMQKSFDSGRLKLDQTKAKACLAAVKTVNGAACWGENGSTKALFDTLTTCQGAVSGTVALGGGCYDTSECASGWCDLSNNACPGKCTAPKAAGASCGADSECQSGLKCPGTTCVAPGAKGAACDSSTPCADGLYCNDQSKCDDTKVAAGAGCTDSLQCPEGSFCNQSLTTPVCQVLAAAGGACDDPGISFIYDFIQAGDCKGQQVCKGGQGDGSNSGSCATPVDVNGACDPAGAAAGPGGAGCYGGLACDTTSKKCLVPPTTAGQSCIGGKCGGDLLCDATTNKCVTAPTAAGQACVHTNCGSGLYCDNNNVCQTLPGAGTACANGTDCADGNYCDGTGTCAALKAVGADCTPGNGECQGSCDSTTNKCVAAAAACTAP